MSIADLWPTATLEEKNVLFAEVMRQKGLVGADPTFQPDPYPSTEIRPDGEENGIEWWKIIAVIVVVGAIILLVL